MLLNGPGFPPGCPPGFRGGLPLVGVSGLSASWSFPFGRIGRWRPAFWISLALLPLVYLLVGDMLWGDDWTAEQRTQMATAVLGVVAMVGAFFLGSSWSSQRKDQQRQP